MIGKKTERGGAKNNHNKEKNREKKTEREENTNVTSPKNHSEIWKKIAR